ncbi:MAG TPA: hypothetical protein PLH15_04090 [Spirochaetota bacterium]|nr:hypothetical protein [Spirochaetota bacterium]HQQ22999.1 hypothetical protein [Spirochaetota bacterium]
MKRIIILAILVLFSVTIDAEDQITQKEYVILTNKLSETKDGKKVKDYKFLDVVKVNKIEVINNKHIGFTDTGEIDMEMTNYITDESKYILKDKSETFYKIIAKIPNVKYYLQDEIEAKYFCKYLDVYYGTKGDIRSYKEFNRNDYIILNNQKVFVSKERKDWESPGYYATSVGILYWGETTFASVIVVYTPAYRMMALKSAFSLTVEEIKEENKKK